MATYDDAVKDLKEAQEADHDNRKMVREADHFVNKRDGQWEPEIIKQFTDKPQYTFDECNPIIDDIMGEISTMDFDIRVRPSGGDASKDVANTYEGIIRNVENISDARFMYNDAARITVGTGFAAWRVITGFRDSDSFQQDLMLTQVPNAQDSVWFDPNAVKQTMEDAGHCFVMTSMTKKAYKDRWPKGTQLSIGIDLDRQVYSYKKPHEVVIAEHLFIKESMRELVLMTNGAVYMVDEKFIQVKDELAAEGITVDRVRNRKVKTVYQRIMDGNEYLTDEAKTIFEYIPIVPVYGNFKVSENKIIYHGVVEKLMDPQRVLNYAESRKIEEGALAPRGKYWATKKQVKSPDVRSTIQTMNTNADPVQIYDHDPESPGAPLYQGAPQSNPGLVETSQTARDFIQRNSGIFDEARGAAPPNRSGYAIDLLQAKSDSPKRKWVISMEIALNHTFRIMLKSIPKVYDTPQKLRLVNQDGTSDTVDVFKKVQDTETGKTVLMNDLSKGQYDVVCTAGPAFHSRQQETVAAINEIAAIDPTIMEIGADVLLNNIASPGIDDIAERKRTMMLQAGVIPESQMNEDELQAAEAAKNAPKQPDAAMVLAQAEQAKADAEMMKAQNKQQETMMRAQIEQAKLQIQQLQIQMKGEHDQAALQIQAVKELTAQIKAQADTLKAIREAMGAETILTPAAAQAYEAQAEALKDAVQ